MTGSEHAQEHFLPVSSLSDLIRAVQDQGYRVLGPTILHDTVMIRPIQSADELPPRRMRRTGRGPLSFD